MESNRNSIEIDLGKTGNRDKISGESYQSKCSLCTVSFVFLVGRRGL